MPFSLFSVQTAHRLGEELGIDLDKRRFRANIFMDLASTTGFAEDEFVGRTVQIGSKVSVLVLERDPRCAMITIDPDTAERNPTILGKVTKGHDGRAGSMPQSWSRASCGSEMTSKCWTKCEFKRTLRRPQYL